MSQQWRPSQLPSDAESVILGGQISPYLLESAFLTLGVAVPSQKQVRWAELRVGLTVIFAAITFAVLIFLMSGTTSMFSSNLHLHAYFDNAGGIREGAPVRLQGVDIGNVEAIMVVADHKDTPVRINMKVNKKYQASLLKGSQAAVATEGVIGGAFIDITTTKLDEKKANFNQPAQDGDELSILDRPDFMDIVRASQSSLQNIDTLVKRLDRILGTIENGQGSIGKLINDPSLFNRLNSTLQQVQGMVNDISSGKGSIGKLIYTDELYNKLNGAVDKVDKIIDDINSGKGSAGLLLKDSKLYDNANKTVESANQLIAGINAGKGALGKFAKDEELAKKLDNTITKLNDLITRVEAGEGSVGMLFKDKSLYTNADQALVEMRNLLKAVREDPKKYLVIHFKIF